MHFTNQLKTGSFYLLKAKSPQAVVKAESEGYQSDEEFHFVIETSSLQFFEEKHCQLVLIL